MTNEKGPEEKAEGTLPANVVPEGSELPGVSVTPEGVETREEGTAPSTTVASTGEIIDEMAIGTEPRHRRGSLPQYFIPWALCWAVVVHAMTGIGLLLAPEDVSSVAILVGLDVFLRVGLSESLFAVILLIASGMAAWGIYDEGLNHPSRAHILFLLGPQYFMVTVGLVNDILILIDGEVMDRPVTFWRGMIGLGPVMVMAIFHNLSIFERYFTKWNRRR